MKYPEIAKRLNSAIAAADMRPIDVATRAGISQQSLSQYMNGKNLPKKETIDKISAIVGVSSAWLMGYDAPMETVVQASNLARIEKRLVPLLGVIACGAPRYAEEQFEAYVMAGAAVQADFCVRAKGDSMTGARIHDGDIVFIRQCPEVENGRIAAVIVNDDTEATLKRFYLYRDKQLCVLKAENPAFDDIILTGKELDAVRVLGEAVAFQSDVM